MSPCSPNDVSFPTPSGPSGPAVPPFGVPVSTPPTSHIPFPTGFPEDLLNILNSLQMIIPPGTLKPALNPNFGKDIFDGIMKLLDQFMPFLMLYKFFLPVLNLIICIIEVLCALMNPFALISAINKLFTQCIPEFLNLFPMFALIIMIISLLLLLLQLILYILDQLTKFITALLKNINALTIAFQTANATSVAAIAKKLASLLCIFQNMFVLLAFFGIIIDVFKELLKLLFSIPPCESGDNSNCCSPTTCPAIVQTQYTNTTGIFKYLPEVGLSVVPGFNADVRSESWQLYDPDQTIAQQFWNIVDGYDVTVSPKPIFFPTDATYSAKTSPQQVAYTVDLRLLYNPKAWNNRPGTQEYIRFKDCIVLFAPTQDLKIYNNNEIPVPSGVFFLAGGSGFLDDGTTVLTGFASDGYTPISDQATLENFLHTPASFSLFPSLNPTDGYVFSDMQYTFKPNLPVLLQKNLVTLGCQPDVALNRAFVNNVLFSNLATQVVELQALKLPDPAAAEQCLLAAVSALRANMTVEGVATFQATTNLCLSGLQTDTENALGSLVGIGFNPCESNFTLSPSTQFTTQPIVVTVNLNENNGIPITTGIPADLGAKLADQIKAFQTFGKISKFTYDGYQAFTANLTSKETGSGSIQIAFQNQILCTNTIPTDGSPPVHTLQSLDYEFVFVPAAPRTGEGDSLGVPRRDAGDLSRDSSGGGD